jgi:hypothetical protein
MRMNMGRATYSHFSTVAHTDEAMLEPAGRLEKKVMPTKPTMNREKPTQMPAARVMKEGAENNHGHDQKFRFHLEHLLAGSDGLGGFDSHGQASWMKKQAAPASIRAWGIHSGVWVRVPEVDP